MTIVLSASILILSIVGALTQSIIFLYIMLIGIALVMALTAFNKLNERHYSYLLYAIGLALLFQSTLMSPGLVGTDIRTEYYFFQLSEKQGWDWTIAHTYNSTIGNVVLAPLIAKGLSVFGVSDYWVFKAIYPTLFALVAPILYFVFKKNFSAKISFLSVLFFLIIPTYSLEMIGLMRQMLAELMFALMLYLVIVSKWKWRYLLIGLCVLLAMGFHYTLGAVLMGYVVVVVVGLLIFKQRAISVKYFGLSAGIAVVVGLVYYSVVAHGTPMMNISVSLVDQLAKVFPWLRDEAVIAGGGLILPDGTPGGSTIFGGQEPLVRTALMLDFPQASVIGKIFRIFQFITQVFVVVGCIQIFRKRRDYTPEYLVFAGASAILLTATIFVPAMSGIINATRFYHITLFLLAPTAIIGGLAILRNYRLLVLGVLIPYFAFTSGVVFELAKVTDISRVNIPYSIPLSFQRIEVNAVFTGNDLKVRDWAYQNNIQPIYADMYGSFILEERYPYNLYRKMWNRFPTDLAKIPSGSFIFLRERNVERNELTMKPQSDESTSGMRVTYSFQERGLDRIIENSEVVYRVGDAEVVRVK